MLDVWRYLVRFPDKLPMGTCLGGIKLLYVFPQNAVPATSCKDWCFVSACVKARSVKRREEGGREGGGILNC